MFNGAFKCKLEVWISESVFQNFRSKSVVTVRYVFRHTVVMSSVYMSVNLGDTDLVQVSDLDDRSIERTIRLCFRHWCLACVCCLIEYYSCIVSCLLLLVFGVLHVIYLGFYLPASVFCIWVLFLPDVTTGTRTLWLCVPVTWLMREHCPATLFSFGSLQFEATPLRCGSTSLPAELFHIAGSNLHFLLTVLVVLHRHYCNIYRSYYL